MPLEPLIPAPALRWPQAMGAACPQPEAILVLEAPGRRPLTLASNYPYELWLDGRFVGDGGHRCTPGEALADPWPEARHADRARVRLHWLDPDQSSVLFRCLFEDPFFADADPGAAWSCRLDGSVRFAARMSAQLPRQNVVLAAEAPGLALELQPVQTPRPWQVVATPLRRARYEAVALGPAAARVLAAQKPGTFRPEQARNLVEYVRDERPCDLRCDTYDLGRIALHRFEVDTGGQPCVLCHGEVASFERTWATDGRRKVHLADAVAAGVRGAAPFGTRGGRYVHVLYPADGADPPVLRVWRRAYPLAWKRVAVEPGGEDIVAACRANLVACVDGGVVDTCWRERAQWTGDLRLSALALRALADNPEVIELALHQIAQSYDPDTGMVSGAWPVQRPRYALPMPPYHLAFCLAALEQDARLERDPLVRRVVHESIPFWKERYLRGGLLRGMPGWYFTDWDPTGPQPAGVGFSGLRPHAVCNAWWQELCTAAGVPSDLDADEFDRAFWTGTAYRLIAGEPPDSPHATAAALGAGLGGGRREAGLAYLERESASGALAAKVTAYYAYFVARALRHRSRERALAFVREFYGPIAREYGTLYEKTSGDASLAHGWSVAVAALLVREP